MPTGISKTCKTAGNRGGRGNAARGGSAAAHGEQRWWCKRCQRTGHWAQDCPVGRVLLSEFFDAQGFKDALRDLAAIEPQNETERARKEWLGKYLDKVDQAYNKVPDANGLRWSRVKYQQRCDSNGKPAGRHQATDVATGPAYADGKRSDACQQGMLRELRGYAVGPSARSCPEYRRRTHGHARDLDFKNCQPIVFSQQPALLTWTNGRAPPALTEIPAFCAPGGRDALYKELAVYHTLDPDSAHYDGYQKDLLKKLTTSLFFGGTYDGWIWRQKLPQIEAHPRIKALQAEIELLRTAIFESEQWAPFVAVWRDVLKAEKKGDAKAIDRSIMARIAQHLEDQCLMAMTAQLKEDGWTVLALIFDGALVRHREGHHFDLARLEERILRDTKLKMTIEEKPLFDVEPKLVLNRDFGA
jgi:hypothetical protein